MFPGKEGWRQSREPGLSTPHCSPVPTTGTGCVHGAHIPVVNSILVLTVSVPESCCSASHLCESRELAEMAVYVPLSYVGSHCVCVGNFMLTL